MTPKDTTLAFVLALALSGCAVQGQRHASFIQSEYDPYVEAGTCKITGQAFVRTRGGDIKSSAGLPVFLNPVTTYSTEWWQRRMINGESLAQADARAVPYFRETTADAQGRFQFTGLPVGQYYVGCDVNWEVVSSFWGWTKTTGARLGAVVKLDSLGQSTDVILKPLGEE